MDFHISMLACRGKWMVSRASKLGEIWSNQMSVSGGEPLLQVCLPQFGPRNSCHSDSFPRGPFHPNGAVEIQEAHGRWCALHHWWPTHQVLAPKSANPKPRSCIPASHEWNAVIGFKYCHIIYVNIEQVDILKWTLHRCFQWITPKKPIKLSYTMQNIYLYLLCSIGVPACALELMTTGGEADW